MRVLAILYCYPPLLVPASICYAKLIAGLIELGVEVELVTIAPGSFDSPGPIPLDPQLAAALPQPARTHEIWSPELAFWARALKKLDPHRRWTRRWFEPRKREWTLPARRTLLRQDLRRFDLILSCSQPHANHLLALDLKRKTQLPWIAYFSDPWTENPYARYPNASIREYNRRLEHSVLATADLVLFTCEEMRRFVLEQLGAQAPAESGVLPHAFIPRWYEAATRSSSGGFRFLHTGSFYGPRTPTPLLDALSRLRAAGRSIEQFRFDSYGGMEAVHRQRIAADGLDQVVRAHDYIPYLESLSLMRSHDALLLIDAPLSTAAESVFLPSKLIDYLGAGVPIVALTPERGATARVVRETGGIVCALERPQELDGLLTGIASGAGLAWQPQAAQIASYSHHAVVQKLRADMERIVSSRR